MRVGIVIVLYNPDVEHVNTIINQFSSPEWVVAVVDNSASSTELKLPENGHYIHCKSNIGIAAAQNAGLKYVFGSKADYAFLLDQDSMFDQNTAETLYRQFRQLENDTRIAAIGPSVLCQFSERVQRGKLQRGHAINDETIEVMQIIASGMLLSKDAFAAVGDKETGLFIDGVDHEWCWRARKEGWKVFQSLAACMPHKQGDARVKLFGLTFKKGAPMRLYYQFRNICILARRSYVPLYWKCRHVCAIPLRYVVNRFCFDEGAVRGAMMIQGLKDGFKHRLGEMSSDSANVKNK